MIRRQDGVVSTPVGHAWSRETCIFHGLHRPLSSRLVHRRRFSLYFSASRWSCACARHASDPTTAAPPRSVPPTPTHTRAPAARVRPRAAAAAAELYGRAHVVRQSTRFPTIPSRRPCSLQPPTAHPPPSTSTPPALPPPPQPPLESAITPNAGGGGRRPFPASSVPPPDGVTFFVRRFCVSISIIAFSIKPIRDPASRFDAFYCTCVYGALTLSFTTFNCKLSGDSDRSWDRKQGYRVGPWIFRFRQRRLDSFMIMI